MDTNTVLLTLINELKQINKMNGILVSLIEQQTKELNEQKNLILQQKVALDGLYEIHNQEALRRILPMQSGQ